MNIRAYFMCLDNRVPLDQYIVSYRKMEKLVLTFDSFAGGPDDHIFTEDYKHTHFDAT